jgi:hypothetical protein
MTSGYQAAKLQSQLVIINESNALTGSIMKEFIMISIYASAACLSCVLGHIFPVPDPEDLKWTQDPVKGHLKSERVWNAHVPALVASKINEELGAPVASGSRDGVVIVTDADAFRAKYSKATISPTSTDQVR